jgi:hypothetical protein
MRVRPPPEDEEGEDHVSEQSQFSGDEQERPQGLFAAMLKHVQPGDVMPPPVDDDEWLGLQQEMRDKQQGWEQACEVFAAAAAAAGQGMGLTTAPAQSGQPSDPDLAALALLPGDCKLWSAYQALDGPGCAGPWEDVTEQWPKRLVPFLEWRYEDWIYGIGVAAAQAEQPNFWPFDWAIFTTHSRVGRQCGMRGAGFGDNHLEELPANQSRALMRLLTMARTLLLLQRVAEAQQKQQQQQQGRKRKRQQQHQQHQQQQNATWLLYHRAALMRGIRAWFLGSGVKPYQCSAFLRPGN